MAKPKETDVCESCGALGESCCDAARARRELANSLSRLVTRQGVSINTLTRERDEARQVIGDLRLKYEGARP